MSPRKEMNPIRFDIIVNVKAYEEAKYVICKYISESKVIAGSRAYINYRNFTLEVSF